MSESRAAARRQRKKPRDEGSSSVWLQRIWGVVTRPAFVGALLMVAGGFTLLAPTAVVPSPVTKGWWIAAYRLANAVQGSVSVILVAAVFAGAIALDTYLHRSRKRRGAIPLFAATLMGFGALVGLSSWYLSHTDVPTSRVSVPPGQTIESYPAIESGRAFKVMLPTRVFVESVDAEGAKAVVELRKPGEDKGIRNDIFVGSPLDVHGYRFALVGLEIDPRMRTAVLGADDGIDVRASRGGKVRFTPEGPEYLVHSIVTDYLGVMGPAVELEGEKEGRFWVFERDAKLPQPLSPIHLRRLESAPVPVFAVAKANTGSLLSAGALLFVLGLALFLLVADVGERSLNELGPQREEA